jgi:uncharacterized protein DUF6644
MSVLAMFRWSEHTALGGAVRASRWMFPVVEAGHLLALTLFGAAVLIVDLRLWNLVLRERPVAAVARGVQPLLIGSLVFVFITGYMLFAAEASRYYYNAAFWFKMIALVFALAFTFTVRRRFVMRGARPAAPFRSRLVGLLSVALWLTVGIGAKAIGFY